MDFDEEALSMTELALTSNPAIEITDGVMLNKDEFVNLNDQVELNKDKQIIASVALVADKWIERQEKNGDTYFISFTPDQVRAFKNAFEKNGGIINLKHTDRKIKGEILLSEIVEDGAEEKIRKEYGYKGKLSKTDYFVALKIEDEKDWEYLKENGMNSFSIQAYFKKNLIKFNKMSEVEKLNEEIEKLKTELSKIKEESEKEEETTETNLEAETQETEETNLEEEAESTEETEDNSEEESAESEENFEFTEEMYNAMIEVVADLSAKVDELATPPVVEEEMKKEEKVEMSKEAKFIKGLNS